MPEGTHSRRTTDTSRPGSVIAPGREYWLHRLLRHAGERKWCSDISCTTCGATPLRDAFRSEAFRAAARTERGRYDRVAALHLVSAIAGLNPDAEEAQAVAGPVTIALNELLRTPLESWLIEEILRGHWAHALLPAAGFPRLRHDPLSDPIPPTH